MIEALAQVRNDPALSFVGKPRPSGRGLIGNIAKQARRLKPRVYLGAALVAVLIGIGVNALVMQHGRHPAPLFAPPPPAATQNAPVAAAPPAPGIATGEKGGPATASPPTPLPAARPTEAVDSGPPARTSDPIGELLKGEARPDASHLILAAQTALAKLGYPVKPDGAEGAATQQALKDFERSHNLPEMTEITPRLVRQLGQAERAGAR